MKNPIKKSEEKNKTIKEKLVEELMFFKNQGEISYYNINYDNDILEIMMQIKSQENTSQFKPIMINLNTLLKSKMETVVWNLPKKSYIKVKYLIYIEKDIDHVELYQRQKHEIENPNFEDLKNKYSLNEDNKPKIIKDLTVSKEENSNKFNIKHNKELVQKEPKSINLNVVKNLNVINNNLNFNSPIKNKSKIIISPSVNVSTSKDTPSIVKSNLDNNENEDNIIINNKEIIVPNTTTNSKCNNLLDYKPIELNSYNDTKHSKYLNYEIKTLEECKEDSIAEAFFICGVNKNTSEININFEEIKSTCDHKECSILFSYKADIITKLTNTISTIDINNIIASFCFPLGIKLCFKNNFNMSNFVTFITNEQGERYYVVIYHYAIKLTQDDYQSMYQNNIIKEYFTRLPELEQYLGTRGDKLDKLIEQNLSICSGLVSSEYIYIPQCAAFITKFPYISILDNCLDSYLKMSADVNTDVKEVLSFLKNILYEIPIPPENSKIMFYLPFNSSSIELPSLYNNNQPLYNYSLEKYFNSFTIEFHMMLFHLIILEQKILFVSDNLQEIGYTIESLISLISPLKWQGTIIPILSEEIIQYIQCFIPFIIGIHEKLYLKAKELVDANESIYVVFLNKKSIEVIGITNKKIDKKQLNKLIIPLPEEYSDYLTIELKQLKKEELKGNELDEKLREIFVLLLVQFFGDYKKYLSYLDNSALFNNDGFLSKKERSIRTFLGEIISNQNFKQFLQLSLSKDNKTIIMFNKLCLKYFGNINIFNKLPSKVRSSSVSASVCNNALNSSANIKKDSSLDKNNTSFTTENIDLNCNVDTYIINPFIFGDSLTDLEFLNIENTIAEYYKNRNDYSKISNDKTFYYSDLKDNDLDCYFEIMNYNINKKSSNEKLSCSSKGNSPYKDSTKSQDIKYCKRYFINKKQLTKTLKIKDSKDHTLSNKTHSTYNLNKISINTITSSTQRKESFKETPEEKQLREIKYKINDTMRCILSSEKISEKLQTDMCSIFTDSNARHYFSTIIYQQKFQEGKWQCLNEEGFDFLYSMIVYCLKYSNEQTELEGIYLITKSLFFYYKYNKKNKNCFLAQEIVDNGNIFDVWLSSEFWNFWFDYDVKSTENTFTNLDDYYFSLLLTVAIFMKDLKLELSIILCYIVDHLGVKYLSSDLLVKELKITITKQINSK